MLQQTQSRPNHTAYRNFHFNKFVANALRDNMGSKENVLFCLSGLKIQQYIKRQAKALRHLSSWRGLPDSGLILSQQDVCD